MGKPRAGAGGAGGGARVPLTARDRAEALGEEPLPVRARGAAQGPPGPPGGGYSARAAEFAAASGVTSEQTARMQGMLASKFSRGGGVEGAGGGGAEGAAFKPFALDAEKQARPAPSLLPRRSTHRPPCWLHV
jgi:hypothetical protein